MPTSEMSANRVYLYITAMFLNLFELFKAECLPRAYAGATLPTIMRELFLIPGKIVMRGHQMVIDIPVYMKHIAAIYQEILRLIRESVRVLSAPESPTAFSKMIFRRD